MDQPTHCSSHWHNISHLCVVKTCGIREIETVMTKFTQLGNPFTYYLLRKVKLNSLCCQNWHQQLPLFKSWRRKKTKKRERISCQCWQLLTAADTFQKLKKGSKRRRKSCQRWQLLLTLSQLKLSIQRRWHNCSIILVIHIYTVIQLYHTYS